MQKKVFEAWLRAHPKGYSYSVIKGYPTECAWVEKNLHVDLDEEYARDRMLSILQRLSLRNGQNSLSELISGNLYNNLATYRRAVGSYRNFLDAPRLGEVTGSGVRLEIETGTAHNSHQLAPATAGEPRLTLETSAIGAGWLDQIRKCTVSELLALHAAALDELREREIVRSANGPSGDYAELLFTRAFGWRRTENSTAGYDAVDWSERRYQIKSRRLANERSTRQLSALRKLTEQSFDFLAAVLFEKDYKVKRAAMIPYPTVKSLARFREHTNSWTFFLDEGIWGLPGVRDVTAELSRAASELDAVAVLQRTGETLIGPVGAVNLAANGCGSPPQLLS